MTDVQNKLPDKRSAEKALRDIGFSSRQAKRMVAVAWPSIVGEEQAALDEVAEQLEGVIATIRERE